MLLPDAAPPLLRARGEVQREGAAARRRGAACLQSLIGGQASLAWDGAAGYSGSAIPCSAAAVAAELRDGAAGEFQHGAPAAGT